MEDDEFDLRQWGEDIQEAENYQDQSQEIRPWESQAQLSQLNQLSQLTQGNQITSPQGTQINSPQGSQDTLPWGSQPQGSQPQRSQPQGSQTQGSQPLDCSQLEHMSGEISRAPSALRRRKGRENPMFNREIMENGTIDERLHMSDSNPDCVTEEDAERIHRDVVAKMNKLLDYKDHSQMIPIMCKILDLDGFPKSMDELDLAFRKKHNDMLKFLHILRQQDLLSKDDPVGLLRAQDTNKMMDAITAAHCSLKELLRMDWVSKLGCSTTNVEKYVTKLAVKYQHTKEYAKAITLCYAECYRNRFRLWDGYLYTEVMTPEGYPTHHWQKKISMVDFVDQVINRDKEPELWGAINTRMNYVVDYLNSHIDSELPRLKEDALVIAWRNGIYFMMDDKFIPYENDHGDPNPEFLLLSRDIVANLYFDEEFKWLDVKDFMAIPNPLNTILLAQRYTVDEIRYIYAMMGRMFYRLKSLDRWEIAMFFLGIAGSGKTTLLDAMKMFFKKEDIASVGNQLETTFGLEPLAKKKAVFVGDVQSQFRMDPGDVQQMISAETIQVARKNKMADYVEWENPMVFAGNDFPRRWVDKRGSMSRRFFVVSFENHIPVKDLGLHSNIQHYKSNILQCMNLAYHWMYKTHGHKDFWSFIPKKFLGFRGIVRNNGDLVQQFVSNKSQVVLDSSQKVPLQVFYSAFNAYLKTRIQKMPEIEPERLKAVLASNNVTINDCHTAEYNGTTYDGEWLIGMTIRQQSYEASA